MSIIDNFQDQEIQRTQADHLKSIEGYIREMADGQKRHEVASGGMPTGQFSDPYAVSGAVGSVTPGINLSGAMDSATNIASMVTSKLIASGALAGGLALGAAGMYGGGVAEAVAPVQAGTRTDRTIGYWGNDPAYQTNYQSTFWGDLTGSVNFVRATQNMYQEDFTDIARENLSARMRSMAVAPLSIMGIDPTSYSDDAIRIDQFDQNLFRYGRGGTGIGGVGLSLSERVSGAAELEMMAMRDLGAVGDQYRYTRDAMFQSGMFMPGQVSGMGQINQMTQQMVLAGQDVAKATGLSLEESVASMVGLRQFGIRDIEQQREMMMVAQSQAVTSGLGYTELANAMSSGGMMMRGTGIGLGVGAEMGRDSLAMTANMYYGGIFSENMINQAGGMDAMAQNLQRASVGFATSRVGQMYYMAGTQDGGFMDIASQAAGSVSSLEGYSNFMANRDQIMTEGGQGAIRDMQRNYMENIFQATTGREFSVRDETDRNIMSMLAINSGQFGDENTARAFAAANFTEEGMSAQFEASIAESGARRSFDQRRRSDLAYQENSFTGRLTRLRQRMFDEPMENLNRGLSNFVYAGSGSLSGQMQEMRRSGRAGFSDLNSGDVESLLMMNDMTISGEYDLMEYDPGIMGRAGMTTLGALEGSTWGGLIGMGIGAVGGGLLGMLGGPVGAVVGAKAGAMAVGKIGAWAGGAYGAYHGYGVVDQLAISTGITDVNDYTAFASVWNTSGGNITQHELDGLESSGKTDQVLQLYNSKIGTLDPGDINNSGRMQTAVAEIASETGLTTREVSAVLRRQGNVSSNVLSGREVADFGLVGDTFDASSNSRTILKKLNVSGWFSDGRSVESFLEDTDNVRMMRQFTEAASAGTADRVSLGNALVDRMRESGVDDSAIKRIQRMQTDPGSMSHSDAAEFASALAARESYLVEGSGRQRVGAFLGAASEQIKGNTELKLALESAADAGSVDDMMTSFMGIMKDDSFREYMMNNEHLSRFANLHEIDLSPSSFRNASEFAGKFGFRVSEQALEQFRDMSESGDTEQLKRAIALGQVTTQGGSMGQSGGSRSPEDVLMQAAKLFEQTGEILTSKFPD